MCMNNDVFFYEFVVFVVSVLFLVCMVLLCVFEL